MHFTLEKPLVADMKSIHALLMAGASAGQLLPRSLANLYNHTRDFHQLRDDKGTIVGCCGLAFIWDSIAEIRSLYVLPELRRAGLGRRLAEACFKEARDFGLQRLFTLTYQPDFFSRLGFAEVGKDTLPQKIWADCINCPKFPDCDEIAMVLAL